MCCKKKKAKNFKKVFVCFPNEISDLTKNIIINTFTVSFNYYNFCILANMVF